MELKFYNGDTLNITQISVLDETEEIKIDFPTNSYTDGSNHFRNPENLNVLTTDENEFVNYTILKTITTYEDDGTIFMSVILSHNGLQSKVELLQEQLNTANEQVEMLTECLLEISELLYN